MSDSDSDDTFVVLGTPLKPYEEGTYLDVNENHTLLELMARKNSPC